MSVTILLLSSGPVFGRSIEKIDFPERIETPKLELNGVGLRRKRKYGYDWKIYVAALYVPKASTDARHLIATRGDKIIDLVFVRAVGKALLVDAWAGGFKRNCEAPCGVEPREFERFNEVMTDVRAGDRIRITITDRDVVTVDVTARTKSTAKFEGEHMRKTVLATFIGDQPGSPELRAGLLGLKSPAGAR